MTEGKIIVVDDEPTILKQIASFLKERNIQCESFTDVDQAIDRIKAEKFDLLISDIFIPGNEHLEFIKKVKGLKNHLPVILMTGYPSMDSAVESIEIPVESYLVKPLDFDELFNKIQLCIKKSKVQHTVSSSRENLEKWLQETREMEAVLTKSVTDRSVLNVKDFVNLACANIAKSVNDINQLVGTVVLNNQDQEACNLLNCPRLESFRKTALEAIDTLQKTKHSFKSKELANLRLKLEAVVKDLES